jgi:hypothetical protein
LEALILFLFVIAIWATVLTYRDRKQRRQNEILEKRVRYYIEIFNRLKLNPTSDGKEDRKGETEEGQAK